MDPVRLAEELSSEAEHIRKLLSAMVDINAPLAVRMDGGLYKLNRLTQSYLLEEACSLEAEAEKLISVYREGK